MFAKGNDLSLVEM